MLKITRTSALFPSIWLWLFASSAFAQATPLPLPPSPSGTSTASADGLPDITFMRDAMVWLSDPSQFLVQNMLAAGSHLLMAIAFLYFSFLSVKMMLESSSFLEYLGQFINGLLMYGMVKLVLDNYSSGIGGGIVTSINTGFNQVVVIMLGLGSVGDIPNNIWAGFQAFLKIGTIEWDSLPIAQGITFSTVFGVATGLAQPYIAMTDFVLMGFSWLVLIADGALFVAIYAYSMMLFAVGMMLGPIMLPFLLLKPLSYIGEGWIKFMFLAGFFRVAGLAIIHINELLAMGVVNAMSVRSDTLNSAVGSTPQFTKIVLTGYTQWAQHAVLSAMILAFALMTFYMLLKVEAIVQALLSGSGSAGLQFGKGGIGGAGSSPGNPPGGGGGGFGGIASKMGSAVGDMAKQIGSGGKPQPGTGSSAASRPVSSRVGEIKSAAQAGAGAMRSVLDAAKSTSTSTKGKS